MIGKGLAPAEEAIFDLDFHAVMHWGRDPALEKHYVPKRSQRARSVLTFFAQDSGTHNLVYGNADISKATQAREVIAFCDHWKAARGQPECRPRHHARHPRPGPALRTRLPGYHAATPDTIQRRFLETPGQIITTGNEITVRLERRAYSPVLRKASLPAETTVPWWGNRTLRYEFA